MIKALLIDDETSRILQDGRNTVVSTSVSGGKDSGALAIAVHKHLQAIGFEGDHVLIHSDLGEIEHTDSLPVCRELAEHLGLELIVVRPLRDLLSRWEYRWECNVARFAALKLVKIMTWASSNKLRFCSSESKSTPICRELKNRFPGKTILNAVGIRGEESKGRAAKAISTSNNLLRSAKLETSGRTWFPIRDYLIEDVFTAHRSSGFRLHEAYTKNGNTRVSCVFCVLAGEKDLRASLTDERTHEVYRRLAMLEAASTFSFQGDRWLSDLAPSLLSETQRNAITRAKKRALVRMTAERQIPVELLFDSSTGFPAFLPTIDQATKLAGARVAIADALEIDIEYTNGAVVRDRYAELLEEKERKENKRVITGTIELPLQATLF